MKIRGKRISNTTIYIALLVLTLLLAGYLIARPTLLTGHEDRGEIGRMELFVKGINRPEGLALDAGGRLFAQSAFDGKISLISKDGKALDYSYVKQYFGHGMELDAAGDFLIAAKQHIVVLDNCGKVVRAVTGFKNIYDVEMGPDNTIYASDAYDNVIYTISPDNKITRFAELGGPRSNTVPNAAGISFDKDFKNLYVVNMYRGELYKISLKANNQAGEIQILGANIQRPNYVDVDENGNAYITCIGDNTVIRINQNSIKETIETKGKMLNPSGVTVKSSGKNSTLYVASRETNCIYKINIGTDNEKKK